MTSPVLPPSETGVLSTLITGFVEVGGVFFFASLALAANRGQASATAATTSIGRTKRGEIMDGRTTNWQEAGSSDNGVAGLAAPGVPSSLLKNPSPERGWSHFRWC